MKKISFLVLVAFIWTSVLSCTEEHISEIINESVGTSANDNENETEKPEEEIPPTDGS